MEDDRHQHDTAKINVGGRHYEVSTSLLLARNPDSMLATLLSDTWREDPSKPIFIDRDGDLFAYVLNYLRYGSIELPGNLPKATFVRELDYYGLAIYDECILQNTPVAMIKLLKSRIHESELHHDMLLIASKCYSEFIAGRTTVRIGNRMWSCLRNPPHTYDTAEMMDVLNQYLLQFHGLKASKRSRLYVTDLDFVLKVQEVEFETVHTPQEIRVVSSTEPTVVEDDSSASSSNHIGFTVNVRGNRGRIITDEEFMAALNAEEDFVTELDRQAAELDHRQAAHSFL